LLKSYESLPTIPCLILDPFAGSGTTLWVARRLGRHAIGIDISNQYKELGTKRAKLDVPAIESYGE
jgi:DNA modification methylase